MVYHNSSFLHDYYLQKVLTYLDFYVNSIVGRLLNNELIDVLR